MATPLGRVILTIDDGVSPLAEGVPETTSVLPRGGRQLTYRTGLIEATLMVGDVSPRLPPGMEIARCVAALWRVRARARLQVLRFSCRCSELPVGAAGGPTSGEGLDALTWEVPGWVMSLGTQDGDLLANRARHGDSIPRAFADESHPGTVEYTPDGLHVPMVNVPADEVVQIHFLVAWAARRATADGAGEWDASTWFAVDQDSAWVLAELAAGTGSPTKAHDGAADR